MNNEKPIKELTQELKIIKLIEILSGYAIAIITLITFLSGFHAVAYMTMMLYGAVMNIAYLGSTRRYDKLTNDYSEFMKRHKILLDKYNEQNDTL